ncbi:MAG: hypothetical protein GWP17_04010 [Aquificales bacterium]|nr:hypothetical protein [Aquificales bacterium]
MDGVVEGEQVGVALALAPDPVMAGAGSTAVFTLTVTNTSDSMEAFDLNATAPAGWDVELLVNGTAVNTVTLPPNIFNSAEFLLLVTPDVGTVVGDYEVAVTATSTSLTSALLSTGSVGVSQNVPDASATISGTVQVSNRGVQINILSGPTALEPTSSATWQIQVSNSGSVADTFDLQTAGVFAAAGQFSTDTVTLNPGQSQTVQLTADNMDFMLPGAVPLVVAATSQADGRIRHQDQRDVVFGSFEAVAIAWQPAAQTVTDTLTADFILSISNTGNVATTYDVVVNTPGGVSATAVNQLTIPAHSAAIIPITVSASDTGTYNLDAVVSSVGGGVVGMETAVWTIAGDGLNYHLYIPVVFKSP